MSAHMTVPEIIEMVEVKRQLPFGTILSRRRDGVACRARWLVAYLLREGRCMSTPQIGRYLNRDHSTILHALQRMNWHLKHNVDLANEVADCLKAVRAGAIFRREDFLCVTPIFKSRRPA